MGGERAAVVHRYPTKVRSHSRESGPFAEPSPVCVCGGGCLCRMQGLEVALVCLETVWDVGCLEGGQLVVKFSQ